MKNLGILIIDKNGTIKTLCVKEYNESDLYKKCGFTKPDGFIKQTRDEGKNNTVDDGNRKFATTGR